MSEKKISRRISARKTIKTKSRNNIVQTIADIMGNMNCSMLQYNAGFSARWSW